MFGRKQKKINKLEFELATYRRENDCLKRENSALIDKLEEMFGTEETIPEGCIKGPWCAACEFSRCFMIYNRGLHDYEPMYVCNKGKTCPAFIPNKAQNQES